jgi:hypothetical protein
MSDPGPTHLDGNTRCGIAGDTPAEQIKINTQSSRE